MTTTAPRARFVLLRDFAPAGASRDDLEELRRQLATVADFGEVELAVQSASTVVAFIPARNQRQRERLRQLLDQSVEGWSVIEERSYQLPATF